MRNVTPYIVVGHYADGPRVTDHASKAEAHRVGAALRRTGITAFAYSVGDSVKFGFDPRGEAEATARTAPVR